MKKANKNILNSFNIYYRYYKQTGLFPFIIRNFLKIILILLLVFLFSFVINNFIIKLAEIPDFIVSKFPLPVVLLFFFLSESFLGLIPPDLFILWVSEFDNFYFMVGILGFISYLGGMFAYFIGFIVRQIPYLKAKTEKFYLEHINNIKKWGAVFIVIAALFPLPYAIACTLAGTIKFPFKNLLWIGLFRIIRFFLYASIIIKII